MSADNTSVFKFKNSTCFLELSPCVFSKQQKERISTANKCPLGPWTLFQVVAVAILILGSANQLSIPDKDTHTQEKLLLVFSNGWMDANIDPAGLSQYITVKMNLWGCIFRLLRIVFSETYTKSYLSHKYIVQSSPSDDI